MKRGRAPHLGCSLLSGDNHPLDKQRLSKVMFRQCASFKEDGQPCKAAPLKDGEFCIMHDPERAKDIAEARKLGGLRRRREIAVSGAYEFNGLDNVSDIRRLIEIAVLDTLGLENSVARNRTIAYLVQVALKALETGEFEERIEALEAAVQGQSSRKSVFDADSEVLRFPSEEIVS